MMFPAFHLAPLGVCLAAGVAWDITRRRIPNAVSLLTAVSGLVVQAIDRGTVAALSGLGAAVLTIALLYRPWVAGAGGLGGGDVKLAASVAVWMGLAKMIPYALTAAASGGVVAIVAYLLSDRPARREMRNNLALAAFEQRLPLVPAKAPGRVSVPYAVAVSAGAVITSFLT